MQEKIMNLFNKEKNRAYKIDEIIENLDIKTDEEYKQLSDALVLLQKNYQIQVSKKGKYVLYNNPNLKVGTVIANRRGFAFVDIDGDKDVFVTHAHLNDAIHGDKVIVELFQQLDDSKADQKIEGKVFKILSREIKNLVGEVYHKDGHCYVHSDNDKIKLIVEILPSKATKLVDGQKVLVKLLEPENNDYYNCDIVQGDVVKIIGHKDDPGVDILSIAYEYGIHEEFPNEVIEELKQIPDHVTEADLVDRKDYRKEMIFTIDGDDTKDIDDAISFKQLPNGNYELGVHIADVTHYIVEDSALDQEAFQRGTSSYLADKVIPQYPHQLSNGICSLNPKEDRLAISCLMEIDRNGKTVSSEIYQSVINSNIQMTYKKVNQILEQNKIPDGYEPYAENLKDMFKLSQKIRANRTKRGSIDFEKDEAKIKCDENGKAIDVILRTRGAGEKLIEDFMIAANEAVAETITYMEYPFVYRVHGEPNEEKIRKFFNFLGAQGIHIKGNYKKIYPKTIQEILQKIKIEIHNKYTDLDGNFNKEDADSEFHIITSLLLRSMQKAVYDTNNIGHFGLASKCYTHFTSPIRRYPDTTVHRLLKKYLFLKNNTTESLNNIIESNKEKLPVITQQSSERERAAVDCERDVDDMKMAEYMMNHIGEKYTGMISSIMNFGMFVTLPNLIEGLIKIDELKDDYYDYLPDNFMLIGRKTKKTYKIGDKICVIVKDANKEARTIDFILPDNKEEQNTKVKTR